MIVKNVAGESRYFTFGTAGGRTLLNNGLATLPDNDPIVMERVLAYVDQEIMQIMEGPEQFGRLATVTTPAYGSIVGSGAISDADYVTVAGLKFVFGNDPGSGELGTYYTALGGYWAGDGAAQATAIATLRTALLANRATTNIDVGAVVTVGTDKVLPLFAYDGTYLATGLTLVKSGANIAISGATLTAGTQGAAKRFAVMQRTATTAAHVTPGFMLFAFPFVPGLHIVSVRTAAGVVKAWDGVATVSASNKVLSIDNSGSGGFDFADTDIVTVFCVEA